MNIYPVVLCGGSGSRLWPLSRSSYPKQFLSLYGDITLLQQTAKRLSGISVTAPIVISNNEQRFIVAEQLREVGISQAQIILEPIGRNTAPAVAVSAFKALEETPDALLMVLPSDHVITDNNAFNKTVAQAIDIATQGKLITFGITPNEPHIGYGYIRRGNALAQGEKIYQVDQFIEKPDAKKALELYESKEYFWNSGMFLFRADLYLQELFTYQPAVFEQSKLAFEEAKRSLDFIFLDSTSFEACPSKSIDYAVMEHTKEAVVIGTNDLGWSDIGSWTALSDLTAKDDNGNNIVGDVFVEEVNNSYLHSETRMIAAIGIDNLVVVETSDAILVAHKDKIQDVKTIVQKLSLYGRPEAINHRKVYRPWGAYEGIVSGKRFQVKRIIVNPGAALSLQMHYHRAEHWIVVSGTARVVNGEQTMILSENQSTYIPIGSVHRLENPGKFPLEMIEVQSGGYLDEDDIVRLEDVYGRITS